MTLKQPNPPKQNRSSIFGILTLCSAFGFVLFAQAAFAQNANPTGQVAPVTPNPLAEKILDFSRSKGSEDFAPSEITWDEAFLDTKHWDQLPAGNWNLESKTETALKYSSNDIRPFLNGPARQVTIHTLTENGKPTEITSIEVTWANMDQVYFGSGTTTCRMSRHESRKEEEYREDMEEEFLDTTEEGLERLTKMLTAKFGDPEQVSMGESRDFEVEALDFKTPTETTIRLFHETNQLLMVVIYPTASLEKGESKVETKAPTDTKVMSRDEWALTNVTKLPNGDVIIKNIPMHNQRSGNSSHYTTLAMIYEYWGSKLPVEMLIAKSNFIHQNRKSQEHSLRYSAENVGLEIEEMKFRMREIMQEIDAGRPVRVTHRYNTERFKLWREWSVAANANPTFEIPKESRKEQRKNWATEGKGTCISFITGYNEEKEALLITRNWGEYERNYRVSFDEMEALSGRTQAFRP